MAQNDHKKGEDLLVAALAAGKSVTEACELAGVSRRTVYRRLDDPAFRRRVTEARASLIERALGQLSEGATEAAQVLRTLLKAESDAVKLGAARAILEQGNRYRETVELEQRLAALEQGQNPARNP